MKLDTTPPHLVITAPTNLVTMPLIQLTGYCAEVLSRIGYDISSTAGTATNQLAVVTGQFFDTTTREFTTNDFHCYDVPLTNGTNAITIRAMDLAGNMASLTTNITFMVSSNPPVVELLWPQDGMHLCGESVTIKGRVNDPTATVVVAMVDAEGNTNTFGGRTGRDGIFWVENVPLNAATNDLSLTASTPAGNGVTNFTLLQSSIGLTINTVLAGQTSVSGNVGSADYTIWVNGVEATQDNGGWSATITPICIGGGQVAVAAIPNSDNGGHGSGSLDPAGNPQSPQSHNTQTTVQPPEGVYLSEYHITNRITYLCWPTANYSTNLTYTASMIWQDGKGGDATASWYWDGLPTYPGASTTDWPVTRWPQELPNGTEIVSDLWESPIISRTNEVVSPGIQGEHCDIRWVRNNENGQRHADAEMKLVTGGPLGSKQNNLWILSAVATDAKTGEEICPTNVTINNFGRLGTDRQLAMLQPDNETTVVTPKALGRNPVKFDGPSPSKYILRIKANNQPLLHDILVPETTFCVGQMMYFQLDGLPSGIIVTNYHWTFGGTYVNGWTNSFPGKEYPECSRNYFVNPSLHTNNAIPTNWWISGSFPAEPYVVSVSCDFIFTNGTPTINATASGMFGMVRPVPNLFAQFQRPIAADTNYYMGGGLWLHFGGELPNPPPNFPQSGIVLGYTDAPLMPAIWSTPRDLYGNYYISQIIKTQIKRNMWSGTNLHGSTFNATGLDNWQNMNNNIGTTCSNIWQDGPGSPLGYTISWVSREDEFTDYFMFKYRSLDSIRVPMYKVLWEWKGKARTNGLDGAFLISQTNFGPNIQPTYDFPYWTNVFNAPTNWSTNMPAFYEY